MDAKAFQLEILTPSKSIFSGQVTSLVAPGALGYLGILANHASLMTALTSGTIAYRDPAGSTKVLRARGSGFLEVSKNQATVLIDEIEGA